MPVLQAAIYLTKKDYILKLEDGQYTPMPKPIGVCVVKSTSWVELENLLQLSDYDTYFLYHCLDPI